MANSSFFRLRQPTKRHAPGNTDARLSSISRIKPARHKDVGEDRASVAFPYLGARRSLWLINLRGRRGRPPALLSAQHGYPENRGGRSSAASQFRAPFLENQASL